MDFISEFKEKTARVNRALEMLLPKAEVYPEVIHQAIRYSVFAGGKRIRPVLTLAAAELLKGDLDLIMPAACALELIHTYTLVHDDLPAMDNDDLRRGMPTCHIKFGEDMAILAGDALQSMAFELLTKIEIGENISAEQLLLAIRELAQAIGTKGVIGGQVVDTISAANIIDKKTLEYIHQNKTGALIGVAVRIGAILACAGRENIERLDGYSKHLGMVFQITDDILDVTASEKVLGKPSGSDIRNNKGTFPSLYGIDEAGKMAAEEA
ncbi:MAG: polyprenyl synthetase family protein, partial [Peptococcaceae bacterium]|nr:polyprenyl synthetase family protein [Peptococcaceae bacterium]